MAVLSVNGICKSFGATEILRDVSFSVNKNDKVAIIGDNGEGKTTLLKIITRQLEADKGSVYFEDPNSVGYLSQQVIDDIEHTLIEEMELAFSPLKKMEREMEQLIEKMGDCASKEDADRYAFLQESYANLGGYEYKYQIHQMLAKFGFDESYYNRPLKTFSGGERTRASFVKLLLNKPSLLLLDEPTNHLDLVMIEWLEKYLKTYSGTVIIVSHDQVFIDNLVNKVIELENHKATMFSGNYTYYANEKQLRYEQALKAYNIQEKEIKRYEMLIRKFRPKPTKTAFAKSLEGKLAKMERIEKPNNKKKTIKAKFEANLDPYNVKMHIVEDLTFGYDNIELTKPLNLIIRNQDKICIMGESGQGKSTLLNILTGIYDLESGTFLIDNKENNKQMLDAVYISQEVEVFDLSIRDNILLGKDIPENKITEIFEDAGLLDWYQNLPTGLDDELGEKGVKVSVGQKQRLNIIRGILNDKELYIFDEPTSNLDEYTEELIVKLIEKYLKDKTLIIVTHREALKRLCNKHYHYKKHTLMLEETKN